MSYPHRIRLRGPWECIPIAEADQAAPRRVTMPCRWAEAGLAGYRGSVRFLRKFGYPGRIDSFEHVWLTCAGCNGCREVRLNGQVLTQEHCDSFAFDVTPMMRERNHLEVLMQGDSNEAGLWGEVALEIRCDAWLTDMQVRRTEAGLRITGIVIGTAPQPLEMYTRVNDFHADYQTLQPTSTGQSLQIDLPGVFSPRATICVELVHISSIWYTVEMQAPE